MWIKLAEERMEITAPCGCIQSFFTTPDFRILRSALVRQCGHSLCEYNYIQLLTVAIRVTACLQGAKPYETDRIPLPSESSVEKIA
ncbi:MAG: hypothetical protein HY313_01860 [Acidobacteria bacterium]|nr:hypothetical protein [Acidobacteriota bacterium]